MLKAVALKRDIFNDKDYYEAVRDILESRIIKELEGFKHHYGVTRFQHSLNVSYYNYLWCKLLRFDKRSAARAGLLHDLFLYDRKTWDKIESAHPAEHPRVAFANASENFSISEREGDIILKHMWPVTLAFPKYKESYIITLADKYCTMLELGGFFLGASKRGFAGAFKKFKKTLGFT